MIISPVLPRTQTNFKALIEEPKSSVYPREQREVAGNIKSVLNKDYKQGNDKITYLDFFEKGGLDVVIRPNSDKKSIDLYLKNKYGKRKFETLNAVVTKKQPLEEEALRGFCEFLERKDKQVNRLTALLVGSIIALYSGMFAIMNNPEKVQEWVDDFQNDTEQVNDTVIEKHRISQDIPNPFIDEKTLLDY